MALPNETRSHAKRVMLVEDDDVLRGNYESLLKAHKFEVVACADKSSALDVFEGGKFDTVILDVTLGSDYEAGFDLCRIFRERQRTIPIIFLTERDEEANRISGLRLGADDYLTKTISSTYLVARINALIRRVEALLSDGAHQTTSGHRDSQSQLRIDDRLSRAYWQDQLLDLSLTQFWILRDLFNHPASVRSVTDLMRAANITVQPNTIVVHIKAIREHIQKIHPAFDCIKSERARGYRWVENITR